MQSRSFDRLAESDTIISAAGGQFWGPAALERALGRVRTYLEDQQQAKNHWVGELSSSALATAISISALHVVNAERYAQPIAHGRRWLVRTQAGDGGWGDAVVDETNINATSLALGALILTTPYVPDEVESRAVAAARVWLDHAGGWETVGDPDRCTLSGPARTLAALAGEMEWRRIKRLRGEAILIPRRLRRTISTTFPAYLSISMLHASKAPHPLNALPTYGLANTRTMEWLAKAQGANGSFEESAFLTSVIILCLTAAGRGNAPWLEPAIQFVLDSQREDGGWPIDRDLETFDTDMTVFAFHEAGLTVPNGQRVREWLLDRQFREGCFPTSAPAGGWAWAMPAGWPDSDDTSYTLLALHALGVPSSAAAVRAGARWLEGMQSSTGAWPTFVRNSKMPFDHDCPYITGHVLSALQATNRLERNGAILERAVKYLAREQRYDGTFPSIWFRESVAGTASVLEALADCGRAHSTMAVRARDALVRLQNDDGGWAGARLQASTTEETSWALLALLRAPEDEASVRAIHRGIAWLIGNQRSDGTWQPAPIGLYYSAMHYSDSYYAVTLPMQALARARGRFLDEYAE